MREHRPREQWQASVDQQRASGVSVMQFCRQENIGYASFCNWRKRLSGAPVADSAASGKAGFMILSSLMSTSPSSVVGWNIMLSLGNGLELQLSQNG
jgi:putative transposase